MKAASLPSLAFRIVCVCVLLMIGALLPHVARTQTSAPFCGDGVIQTGEDCDAGGLNGQAGGFCSADCRYAFLACFYNGCGCYENGQEASEELGGAFATPSQAGLSGPEGVMLNAKHHLLFIADTAYNRVIIHRLTANNELRDEFADGVLGQNDYESAVATSTISGFNRPVSTAFDPENNTLFVSDRGNRRIVAFEGAVPTSGGGKDLLTWRTRLALNGGSDNVPDTELSDPRGIAFSRRGYLYVADSGGNRIVRYDLRNGIANVTNDRVRIITQSSVDGSAKPFRSPADLVYDDVHEVLYVADAGNHRILKIRESDIEAAAPLDPVPAEQFGLGFQPPAITGESLQFPEGVAVKDEYLLVSDTFHDRVLLFDKDLPGEPALRVFGKNDFASLEDGATTFARPVGIATVPDNCNILIADAEAAKIVVMGDTTCGEPPEDPPDPPTEIRGISTVMPDQIYVLFTVPLDPASATDIERYRIENLDEPGPFPPDPILVPVTSAEQVSANIVLLRTVTDPPLPLEDDEQELQELTTYKLIVEDMLAEGAEAGAEFDDDVQFTTGELGLSCPVMIDGECCNPAACVTPGLSGSGSSSSSVGFDQDCRCCGCAAGFQCGAGGSPDVCAEITVPPPSSSPDGGDDEGGTPTNAGGGGLGGGGGDTGGSASSSSSSSSVSIIPCNDSLGGGEACVQGEGSCTEFGYSCKAIGDSGCGCESSCPFVYSWNGEEFVIESETIPFSFLSTLEDTSYGALRSLAEIDGRVTLQVREERDETSYIDSFSLLQVAHNDPDAKVYPDVHGALHTIKDASAASWCESSEWENCTSSLSAKDDDIFEIDPLTVYERSPDDLTHWITLGFPKPENAPDTAKLLLNVETTFAMDVVAYRHVGALGGRGQRAMNAMLHLPFLRNLFDTNFDLGKLYLHVEVWNGKEWVKQGVIKPGNYRHWDDFVLPIDVRDAPGDDVRVRLTSVGWYLYNFAGLDWSENAELTVTEMPPASAVKNDTLLVEPLLRETDGERLVLRKGDLVTLSYDVPPPAAPFTEFVFALTGHYLVDVPPGGASIRDTLQFFSYMFDVKNGMNRGFADHLRAMLE